MAEEQGKVVVVYLFGDGVFGCWEGVSKVYGRS